MPKNQQESQLTKVENLVWENLDPSNDEDEDKDEDKDEDD